MADLGLNERAPQDDTASPGVPQPLPPATPEAGWIECPDCQGGAGWYGCYDCGAALSYDMGMPPEGAYCVPCQKSHDCIDAGGHHHGPIERENHNGGAFKRYFSHCACGHVYVYREGQVTWEGRAGTYVLSEEAQQALACLRAPEPANGAPADARSKPKAPSDAASRVQGSDEETRDG